MCRYCDRPALHPHMHSSCATCRALLNTDRAAEAAHAAVGKAVASGRLPRARTFLCVDCGKQALDWDHRDYLKPLEVEPVCRGCNKRRGPALNGVVSELLALKRRSKSTQQVGG